MCEHESLDFKPPFSTREDEKSNMRDRLCSIPLIICCCLFEVCVCVCVCVCVRLCECVHTGERERGSSPFLNNQT